MSARARASASSVPSAEDVVASLRPLPSAARRSRLLVGLLLVVVSAAVTAWLFASAGDRVEVLVVARDVPIGTVISASDVASTRVGADRVVRTVPAAQARGVVGRIAAVDLRAGTLLSPGHLTTVRTPGQGQQIVAVGLKASQLPAGGLAPGDQVLVVPTPGAGGDAGGAVAAPLTREVAATTDRMAAPDAEGGVVVNLLVAAEVGPAVARQASLGRVALVVTVRRP